VANVVLWTGWDSVVPVGGSTQVSVALQAAGPPYPIDVCVTWSIAPADMASIGADGVVTVPASTPPGTVLDVTADVEDGRRILTTQLTTYESVQASIVGLWTEVSQSPCGGGPLIDPEQVIYELQFVDTGDVRVTWQPFELYVDYWGTWTYDESSGALSIAVTGGNYVPDDLDTDGTATLNEDGQLVLTDMWLGTPIDGSAPAACGHVFE
jgi:hypothetical protein